MLESLHIRNIALIDEVELQFGEGLNILTGETGAGKSMIIDSLGLILGMKAGRDVVRMGQEQAVVTAVFCVKDSMLPMLEEMGIEPEEGRIIISRSISATGKSGARINGVAAPATTLRELGQSLVDIHGQHEHQSLLSQAKHILLLDKFADSSLIVPQMKLASAIKQYRDVSKEATALTQGESLEVHIDMLSYQRDELEAAGLYADMEEELSNSRSILQNALKIRELAQNSLDMLNAEGDKPSALEQVSRSSVMLTELGRLDKKAARLAENIDVVQINLAELCTELREYLDDVSSEAIGDIDEVERKLDGLHTIKRKYGGSVEAAMERLDNVRGELDRWASAEVLLERLSKEKKRLLKDIAGLCAEMSGIRQKKAGIIAEGVNVALADMGMNNAAFEVRMDRRTDFGANGFDSVEFMISANKGEPLRPLAKIASGGEMSRVMLALKSVLADTDYIDTFIFDEIDTGVSGRTAQKVGEKMARLAMGRQILCITHLPQIAALADSHFLIEKNSDQESTRTRVHKLNDEECVEEIARLTGGAKITTATLEAAQEMKRMAQDVKIIPN